MSADNCEKRQDSLQDFNYLFQWISRQPELDSKRLVVDGGSYGGFAVLSCLVNFGDRIAGAMERVGISNIVTFLENTSEYRRDRRRQGIRISSFWGINEVETISIFFSKKNMAMREIQR